MALGVATGNSECLCCCFWPRRCQRVRVAREQGSFVLACPVPLGAPRVEMLMLTWVGAPSAQIPSVAAILGILETGTWWTFSL